MEFRGCMFSAVSILLIGLFANHDAEFEDMHPGLGFDGFWIGVHHF